MYDLHYTEAHLRVSAEQLALNFVKSTYTDDLDGGTVTHEDTPFKLRVALTDWMVDGGVVGGVAIGFLVRPVTGGDPFMGQGGEPSIWEEEGVPDRVAINLAQENQIGAQRGTYSHVDPGPPEKETQLPRAARAELYFDRPLEEGRPVSGKFHVTFQKGVEPASGRTVYGSFDIKRVE